MTRWFYADRLVTAWMAKHFGMRFTNGDQEICVTPLVYSDADAVRFIHPDSLHILDLQLGDVAQTKGLMHPFRQVNITELRDHLRAIDGYRVMERDGKVFHWPEREAASPPNPPPSRKPSL